MGPTPQARGIVIGGGTAGWMAAALLAACAAAPVSHAQEPAHVACSAPASCIDAILDAARAGRQADEFASLWRLRAEQAPARPSVLRTTDQAPGLTPGSTLSPPPRQPPSVPPAPRPLPPPAPPPPETLGIGNVDATLHALVDNAGAPVEFPELTRARALGYLNAGQADQARALLEDALRRDPVHASYWTDLALVYARQGEHARAVAALIVADTWAFDRKALRSAYREAAGATPEPGLGRDFDQALQAIAAFDAEQARLDAQQRAATPGQPASADPARKPARVDFGSCDKPMYPRAALRREQTGRVTVAFLIGADGRVQRFRKIKSSGYPLLDNAALFSLAVCRFHPATVDGAPVPSWQPVQYVWTLDGPAQTQQTAAPR